MRYDINKAKKLSSLLPVNSEAIIEVEEKNGIIRNSSFIQSPMKVI